MHIINILQAEICVLIVIIQGMLLTVALTDWYRKAVAGCTHWSHWEERWRTSRSGACDSLELYWQWSRYWWWMFSFYCNISVTKTRICNPCSVSQFDVYFNKLKSFHYLQKVADRKLQKNVFITVLGFGWKFVFSRRLQKAVQLATSVCCLKLCISLHHTWNCLCSYLTASKVLPQYAAKQTYMFSHANERTQHPTSNQHNIRKTTSSYTLMVIQSWLITDDIAL